MTAGERKEFDHGSVKSRAYSAAAAPGSRTALASATTAVPVSFGFSQSRPMPDNPLDLTGVVYDPALQVATVDGVPYAELGGPLAATVRQTREDGQLWDDKD